MTVTKLKDRIKFVAGFIYSLAVLYINERSSPEAKLIERWPTSRDPALKWRGFD